MAVLLLLASCKKADYPSDMNGYPDEIGEIMLGSCAIAGCHNEASKHAAAGLSLESWESMMNGSRNGAVTVPFSHAFSPLFLFTNTYEEYGVSSSPVMPFNAAPLSKEQILSIRFWINDGAPSRNGEIAFSGNQNQYYVLNKGCDQVAVMDAATDLVTRYVKVTFAFDVEFANQMVIAPGGQHWYTVSANGQALLKFSAADQQLVDQTLLGQGKWDQVCIGKNGGFAFVASSEEAGKLGIVDLGTMQLAHLYDAPGTFRNPTGPCYDAANDVLFMTCASGNFIYKIDMTDPGNMQVGQVVLEPGQPASFTDAYAPRQVFLAEGLDKYFVPCTAANEIRVFNTSDDQLAAVIPIFGPTGLAYDQTRNYLFVSSQEDTLTFPGQRGAVSVFDAASFQLVSTLHTGTQPHGMAVDTNRGRLIVTHRNISTDGPKPHHVTECEGRNGYLTFADLNTLALIPGQKTELTVDPVVVKFP